MCTENVLQNKTVVVIAFYKHVDYKQYVYKTQICLQTNYRKQKQTVFLQNNYFYKHMLQTVIMFTNIFLTNKNNYLFCFTTTCVSTNKHTYMFFTNTTICLQNVFLHDILLFFYNLFVFLQHI